MTKIDSSRQAYVDNTYYWQEIETAPLGAKIQILTSGGVAIHGKLNSQDKKEGYYIGWTPLPKIPSHIKEKL